MKQPVRLIRRRGVGLLIAFVVTLSIAADTMLILQQRQALIGLKQSVIEHQLQFIEKRLLSDIVGRRLDEPTRALTEWAADHPDIGAYIIVDGQGKMLVQTADAEDLPIDLTYTMRDGEEAVLTLKIALDDQDINAILLDFALKLVVVTVVIALMFGLSFWQGLKKVAVAPLKMEISRRKAAQAALRRERDAGQRYLDTAEVILLVLDTEGRVSLINRKGCEIVGYEERELKGRNWFDICVPEDVRSRSLATFRGIIAERPHANNEYENEVLTKSGERRFISWRCNVLSKGSGRIIGSICSGEDITERREAAQALADSERRLRTLIDNVADCIITIDEGGIVESVNSATLQVFGYDEKELIGRNVSMLMDDPNASEHDGYLHSYMTTGETKILGKGPRPVLGKRKDGSLCELELMVSEMWLSGHRFFIGILRDVTVRNQRERELRRSREELATIIANTSDVVFSVDRDFRLTQVNFHAEQFFGKPQDTLVGEVLWDAAPELVSYFFKAINTALGQSRTESFEGYYPPQDVWFEARVCPSLDGVGVFLTDITMRKTYERKLQRLHDKAVAGAQLQSVFLANMSHEIRAPINGVLGVLQLLEDSDLDESQRQYVSGAHGCGQTLLKLVNDLLDLSRIEAGRLTLEAIDFEVRDNLDDALDMMAQRAQEKSLQLVGIVAPDVPRWVVGDPTRLQQILINLIGNAIKFTQKGEVWVDVSVQREPLFDQKEVLRFKVGDSGLGIPAEHLETIFEAFTQGGSSTVREYGGTGLGLTITRQLVEAMGGEINVESTPNEGSVFTFTVSLGSSGKASSPVKPSRKCNVLVADGQPHVRQALAGALEALGVGHREVGDGAKALAELSGATPFDVLLVDYELAQDEQFGLLSAIRRDAALDALTVVLLTPLGVTADQHAADLKVTAYLKKPVRHRALTEMLVAWAKEASQPKKSPPSGGPAGPAGGGQLKILVVEDNEVNRRVAVGMLRKLGYCLDIAADGQEAVDAVAAGGYDLVLMDCQMPVMSGFEATERIRAAEGDGQHVPIVAMTANAMGGDERRCREVGMDDYIAKPVQIGLLKSVLEKWLQVDAPSQALSKK